MLVRIRVVVLSLTVASLQTRDFIPESMRARRGDRAWP